MSYFVVEDKNRLGEILLKYEFVEIQLDVLIKGYVFKNKYNSLVHVSSRLKSHDSAI